MLDHHAHHASNRIEADIAQYAILCDLITGAITHTYSILASIFKRSDARLRGDFEQNELVLARALHVSLALLLVVNKVSIIAETDTVKKYTSYCTTSVTSLFDDISHLLPLAQVTIK